MLNSFLNIRAGLMVGIAGGAPTGSVHTSRFVHYLSHMARSMGEIGQILSRTLNISLGMASELQASSSVANIKVIRLTKPPFHSNNLKERRRKHSYHRLIGIEMDHPIVSKRDLNVLGLGAGSGCQRHPWTHAVRSKVPRGTLGEVVLSGPQGTSPLTTCAISIKADSGRAALQRPPMQIFLA